MMSILILLLMISIVIAGAFLVAFLWSVHDGQFDDEFSASHKALFDEDQHKNK